MPTAAEARQALERARAAGDTDAVNVLMEDYRRAAQEESAQNQAAARQQLVNKMSPAEAFWTGTGRGLTNIGMNVADIASKIPGLGGIKPSEERWKEFRELSEPLLDRTAGKVGNFVGETAGTLPIGMGVGGAAAKVAPRLGSALAQAIIQGSAEGAVQGGPENRTSGAVMGAAGGAVPVLAGKGIRNLYQGFVKPSDSALHLMDQGVKGWTLGRIAPGSGLGQIEEAATSFPVIGPMVARARQRPVEGWQEAQMRHAFAPGSAPKGGRGLGESMDDWLAHAYDSFESAYGKFKGTPAYAGITTDDLAKALKSTAPVQNPGQVLDIRDAMRAVVNASPDLDPAGPEAGNVLRRLLSEANNLANRSAKGGAGGLPAVDSGDLLKLREQIRKAAKAVSFNDPHMTAKKDLFRNAESVVNEILKRDLPNYSELAPIDRAYANWNVMSNTVAKGMGRPGEFTPHEAMTSFRSKLGSKDFSLGRGGPEQHLAEEANKNFAVRVPLTGARYFLTPLGVLAPVMTSETAAKALTGTHGWQRALKAAEDRTFSPEAKRRIGEIFGTLAAQRGRYNVSQREQQAPERSAEIDALLEQLRKGQP